MCDFMSPHACGMNVPGIRPHLGRVRQSSRLKCIYSVSRPLLAASVWQTSGRPSQCEVGMAAEGERVSLTTDFPGDCKMSVAV